MWEREKKKESISNHTNLITGTGSQVTCWWIKSPTKDICPHNHGTRNQVTCSGIISPAQVSPTDTGNSCAQDTSHPHPITGTENWAILPRNEVTCTGHLQPQPHSHPPNQWLQEINCSGMKSPAHVISHPIPTRQFIGTRNLFRDKSLTQVIPFRGTDTVSYFVGVLESEPNKVTNCVSSSVMDKKKNHNLQTVSYTHLTLPTKLSV